MAVSSHDGRALFIFISSKRFPLSWAPCGFEIFPLNKRKRVWPAFYPSALLFGQCTSSQVMPSAGPKGNSPLLSHSFLFLQFLEGFNCWGLRRLVSHLDRVRCWLYCVAHHTVYRCPYGHRAHAYFWCSPHDWTVYRRVQISCQMLTATVLVYPGLRDSRNFWHGML